MYSNEIIVTTESVQSQYMEDVINSNVNFLNKLFEVKIKKNEVSKEAMQSYYVDFYQKSIKNYGFSQFMYYFYADKDLITNIEHALANLGCPKNLLLFNQSMHFVNRLNKLQNITQLLTLEHEYKEEKLLFYFNEKFKELQTEENLVEKNHHWLIAHSKLTLVKEHNLKNKLLEVHLNILERYKKESLAHI